MNLSEVRKQLLKTTHKSPVNGKNRCRPGTRLVKEWHGEIYEVKVLEKGFPGMATISKVSLVLLRLLPVPAGQGPVFLDSRGNSCTASTIRNNRPFDVQYIPANPQKRGWSSPSTRPTLSGRPVRPTPTARS